MTRPYDIDDLYALIDDTVEQMFFRPQMFAVSGEAFEAQLWVLFELRFCPGQTHSLREWYEQFFRPSVPDLGPLYLWTLVPYDQLPAKLRPFWESLLEREKKVP